jgi:hypothetical protein
MAYPSRVALGAPTLVRSWLLDVDSAYPSAASWIAVSGVGNFNPQNDPTLKTVTTNDDAGSGASIKTEHQWSLEFTCKRAPQAASLTAYDPGQEKLRAAGLALGQSNLVHVRWYEYNGAGLPVTEAWEGVGTVDWNEGNNNTDDARVIKVKIMGYGARTAVSPNPASS